MPLPQLHRFLPILQRYVRPKMQKSSGNFDIQSELQCQVSKPILIKQILVHAIPSRYNKLLNMIVHLTQHGRQLHQYNGLAPTTLQSAGSPDHYAINMTGVRVEAGALCLSIRPYYGGCYQQYYIPTSPPQTSQLSDHYVTVSFQPVYDNLLFGIEYTAAK